MNIVYPNCYNLDITALHLLRSLSLLHKRFAYHMHMQNIYKNITN